MKFRKRFYYFLINEIRTLRRHPFPLFCATVFPIIALVFLVLVFSNSAVRDVPVVVVDEDNSALSRKLTRRIDATEALKVVKVTSDKEVSDEMFRKSESYITVVFRNGMELAALTGESGEVIIEENGMVLLYSKVAYRAVASIILEESKNINIRRFVEKGMSLAEAEVRSQPVTTEVHTKTNPYYDYSIFLVPGLIMAILQMSAAFSTIWLFRRHVEHSDGRILPRRGNRTAFLFGRLIPIFMANVFTLLFCLIVLFPMANVPISSCFFDIFALGVLFMGVSMGMGAFFSIFLSNIVTGVQMGLLINAPAFVFSGFTFPKWAMPDIVRATAQIEPLTHFLDGFFPMFIFERPTLNGVVPLLIEGGVLWGLVVLLLYAPGDYLRSMSAKLFRKAN